MAKKTYILRNPHIRANAARRIMEADDGHVVTVGPASRSTEQNKHFHALCNDISKSGLEWMGKTRKPEDWKVLLVSGHSIATKQDVEVLPGLEGEFVNIRESTAKMGVKRAASLIEYTIAFAVENGVELHDTRQGGFMGEAA